VTLGHCVPLKVIRQFQEWGHKAVLIIGDYTARVGDPSGRSSTRPMLSAEEIDRNAHTFQEQAYRVLDPDSARVEVRRNGEWLDMPVEQLFQLVRTTTLAQLLERDDFSQRHAAREPISLLELLYPVLQGYDSVAIEADVEMGGTDQTFNLLVGRDIQRAHEQEPQVAFTMPLLAGTDGNRKMSKSLGNHVGLVEPPEEQFGKVMSIPDDAMPSWFRLCTDLEPGELDAIDAGLEDGSMRPDVAKRRLAREIVRLYRDEDAARDAEARFDRIHREHELPDDVPQMGIPSDAIRGGRVWLPRLLVASGLAASNAEARRLIEQGGVRLDGEPVADPEREFRRDELSGQVLQVGRRRFVRLV
jgi:tyrosyl-tRNA synthetase